MSKRALNVWLVLSLAAWAVMVVLFWTSIAHGQAASQPAVVAGGAWAWFTANAWWVVPIAINLLSSTATALTDYPKAKGVVGVLRILIALLGNCEFKDGKKLGFVLKVPGLLPVPPPAIAPAPAAPAADPKG